VRTRRRVVLVAAAATGAVAVAIVAGVGARHEDDTTPDGRPGTSAAATPGSVPPGAANEGSEVLSSPDDDAAPSVPPRPRRAGSGPADPLVAAAPRTASRRGALVRGFPASVVPVVSGSTVRSSGVSSLGGAVQVSIVADTSRSPGAVLAFYRRSLRAHDFVESAVPAVAGSVASRFARGGDHLVVTTGGGRDATSYSVLGTLRTGDRR
jgi:hypothetical protein